MKIIIRFKSKFELPVTCEKFEISKSVVSIIEKELDINTLLIGCTNQIKGVN